MTNNRWVNLAVLAGLGILLGLSFIAGMMAGQARAVRQLDETAWAWCTANQQEAEAEADQCQEELARERAVKLDTLRDLRRTQVDRDNHYEDELQCYQDVFELKQQLEDIPTLHKINEGLRDELYNLSQSLALHKMAFGQAKDELALCQAKIEELNGSPQ